MSRESKAAFPGFPPEALAFFRGLARNNKREWFQPRKELFDTHVKAPMYALVEALNAELARFAPQYITEPKNAVFRIYRDTRFSADKTPYKDHIAASFRRRGGQQLGSDGFYFSVNHKEIGIAGGVYHPEPGTMLAIRSHIAETYTEFQRLLKNSKLRKLMGEVGGDELVRVPKGFDPEHPAISLIKKKEWVFYQTLNPELVTTSQLLKEIAQRFESLTPVVSYLNTPLSARKKTTTYLQSDRF